jgi:ubiquinone/menaquinone biosynthesis C-methylase UbiE
MTEDSYLTIQRLVEANVIREPVLRSAIRLLDLAKGSSGVDVGCGIGLQTFLLADEVGPAGHVSGVDIDPVLLEFAANQVGVYSQAGRVSFRQGDMRRLSEVVDCVDWIWSCDCVGYPAGDLLPLLDEMVSVLKPGGRVIILAWSSQQVLPGHPLLEARLNATCSSYIPFLKDADPDAHFHRALYWFRQAGLVDLKAHTFTGSIQAPLNQDVRTALTSLFDMLWGQKQPSVTAADWSEFQRFCTPGSADFILDLPDYYGFITYTMFEGKKAQPGV